MARDYLKLPREVQLATLANLHEMAMKFPVKRVDPLIAQPKPAKGRMTVVSDPPGMPVRRFGAPAKTANKAQARTFDGYFETLSKNLKQSKQPTSTWIEIKHFSYPYGKAAGE